MSLTWKNQPLESTSDAEQQISITTGIQTDWFIDPGGEHVKDNAPIALFVPPDSTFKLQAKVTVEFAATYDAGTLFVYAHDALWAKLCLNIHPPQPCRFRRTVASPTTAIPVILVFNLFIYVSVANEVLAFHSRYYGHYWHFVRHFSLRNWSICVSGFNPSPLGQRCKAIFRKFEYKPAIRLRTESNIGSPSGMHRTVREDSRVTFFIPWL